MHYEFSLVSAVRGKYQVQDGVLDVGCEQRRRGRVTFDAERRAVDH